MKTLNRVSLSVIAITVAFGATSAVAQAPAPNPTPTDVQIELVSKTGAPPADVICQDARAAAVSNLNLRCNPPDRPNLNLVPQIVNEISRVNQVSPEESQCQVQVFFRCRKP